MPRLAYIELKIFYFCCSLHDKLKLFHNDGILARLIASSGKKREKNVVFKSHVCLWKALRVYRDLIVRNINSIIIITALVCALNVLR